MRIGFFIEFNLVSLCLNLLFIETIFFEGIVMKETDSVQDPILNQEPDDEAQLNKLFKDNIIEKLSIMRENIQPLLFETSGKTREEFVQRANFLYALMFKIKNEFKRGENIIDWVASLAKEYPLAVKTIKEVEQMDEVQRDYVIRVPNQSQLGKQ